MAAGSQQPSRGAGNPDEDWFGGRETCSECGKKLTLKNFGHVRTTYPSRRRDVYCLACVEKTVREAQRSMKERLGLA